MELDGLLSFPLTPFADAASPDGGVDLEALREHIAAQLAAGPVGLFVACGTGEYPSLSEREYAAVVATAVDAVAGAVPVFAGVGGGVAIARQFARTAETSGADGLLLLPPYLVSSTEEGQLRHIRHVAAATPLPMIVYLRANARLSAAGAVDLLDVATVMGIKDGLGDVEGMQRIITAVRSSGHPRAHDFGFLNGLPTAELSVRAYRGLGVRSYSSAVMCFAPDIAVAFHRAVSTGDDDLVNVLLAEFYLPFAALRDLVPGYAVSLVKAGARLSGLRVGGVRPPLVDPPPAHEELLAAVVARGRAALRVPTEVVVA
jgi:5-dehydro-4-deoxyglucarate dehydratase